LAAVSSGADLHPVTKNPAPNKAIAPKDCNLLEILTFPPYTASNGSNWFDPPFLTYFELLSMAMRVTLRTPVEGTSRREDLQPIDDGVAGDAAGGQIAIRRSIQGAKTVYFVQKALIWIKTSRNLAKK
jgi:hypothetical protein